MCKGRRYHKGDLIMSTVRIAQLQLSVLPDKEESLARMERACARAAEQGADLVALPEMFCCPYEVGSFPAYAEEEGGRVWTACSAAARTHGVYLCAGTVPERGRDGRIFNTAYVFDRDGRQLAKHRKMHLFDIDIKGGQRFRESETLSPGESVTVFETEFGVFGLCVCYDFRFPELGRLMALAGAQAILVPAAFNMTTGPAHWELTFRSQALYNQVFAVGTAPARDPHASYTSWGHSIVTDPWGEVIAQLDEKPGMQLADLALCRVSEVREQLPLLRHRRTDVYQLSAPPRL